MMTFRPFEDKEEVERIEKEREELIRTLQTYDMESSERQFILRKINHISEKLLQKARYMK